MAAELVRVIAGWTPGQLIYRMRIDQPRVSDLRRGRLERISLERLVRWLHQMGQRVELRVVNAPEANAGAGSCGARAHGNSGMRSSCQN